MAYGEGKCTSFSGFAFLLDVPWRTDGSKTASRNVSRRVKCGGEKLVSPAAGGGALKKKERRESVRTDLLCALCEDSLTHSVAQEYEWW